MYGGKFSLKIKYSNLNVYKRSQLILYRAIVQVNKNCYFFIM